MKSFLLAIVISAIIAALAAMIHPSLDFRFPSLPPLLVLIVSWVGIAAVVVFGSAIRK